MRQLNYLHRAWPHRGEIQPAWMSSRKVLVGNWRQHLALPSLWGDWVAVGTYLVRGHVQ